MLDRRFSRLEMQRVVTIFLTLEHAVAIHYEGGRNRLRTLNEKEKGKIRSTNLKRDMIKVLPHSLQSCGILHRRRLDVVAELHLRPKSLPLIYIS